MRARPCLLLVDLQWDYLSRDEVTPPASVLVERAARLLDGFRAMKRPVIHVHTRVRRDGTNRMPHWRRADHWACIEGTPGSQPPPELAPHASEHVVAKPFYSAWGDPALAAHLRELAADTLVVAGLYTHACIQASVLDAYQAGFEVWLASDAVGSYDALHAELSRRHLDGRACCALPVRTILARLGDGRRQAVTNEAALPVAHVDGEWVAHRDQATVARHDPADWSMHRAVVPLGSAEDMALAVDAAAARQPKWGNEASAKRGEVLTQWIEALTRHREQLVAQVVAELGKPYRDAQAEFDYAVGLISAVRSDLGRGALAGVAAGVRVRHCPVGTVGLITPWNNPLALPIGKLAPALAWGNAAVWKAPIEAPRTAMLLMTTLAETSLPAGLVNMVFGDAHTAEGLLHHPRIAAVSFTGSNHAGRQVRAVCAMRDKPLQAELGGNNAAVVTASCELDAVAREIATAAYSFAGQRCTALRRVIVQRQVYDRFMETLVEAVAALRIGLPDNAVTQVGPLVSRAAQQRIDGIVTTALAHGATLMHGGRVPAGYERGCWYEPTLLSELAPASEVVRQESFGPVMTVMRAEAIDEAIERLNDVEHGLVATLYCDDVTVQRCFVESAQAGILRINTGQTTIHPAAPFGGWKASGVGPPEHGAYDRMFYTRAQAIYGRFPE